MDTPQYPMLVRGHCPSVCVGDIEGLLHIGHCLNRPWAPFILRALSDQQSQVLSSRQKWAEARLQGVELDSLPCPTPYLLHHHSELALGAEHRLDP